MRISFVLLLLLVIPVLNSFFVNSVAALKNFYEFIQLKAKKQQLLVTNNDLKKKLKLYRSQTEVKKTIRENIKLIEKNEILLRLPY